MLLCVQRSTRGSVKLASVPDAQCTHEKKNELAKYSRAGFNLRAQGQTAQRSMRTVLLIATLSSKALRRNLHAHNRLVCGAQTEARPKAAKKSKPVAHPRRLQVERCYLSCNFLQPPTQQQNELVLHRNWKERKTIHADVLHLSAARSCTPCSTKLHVISVGFRARTGTA